MNPEEKHYKTQKTGRYYLSKPHDKIDEKTKKLIFVIHGYAQLAKDFIQEFEFLNNDETLIIAPEGLSRFYSKNVIAASWMTKEDRDNEIDDYLFYLEGIANQILSHLPGKSEEIIVLGFSQGVHTATRFAVCTEMNVQKLVLCSSDFPQDADFESMREKNKTMKVYYMFGDKDKNIRLENFEKSIEMLNENKIVFEKIVFDGEHVIHQESVLKIL
jgi:predicted esterase